MEKPKTSSRFSLTSRNVLILLVVLTALEVGASYLAGPVKTPILLVFAAIKAVLVVLYFMHLRHDSRLYALLFLIGGILIIPLVLFLTLVR